MMTEKINNNTPEDTQRKNFQPVYLLYIAGIIGTFFTAFHLRKKFLEPFFYIFSIDFNAVKLFLGILNQGEFLSVLLKHFAFKLFAGYYLSSLLCLIAIGLLYLILKDFPKSASIPDIIQRSLEKNGRLAVIVGSVMITALMVLVHFHFLMGVTISTDEFSYDFQANLLKNFHLSAPAPDYPEFFNFSNIIIYNGKWFSKYTLGFPLFLSPGSFLGLPYIVNPILSILAAFFIFRITELLFSKKTALLSVFLTFLSPFFFFNGAAAFQPHMAVACSLLGSAYYYFLTVRKEKFQWHYGILCAVFFTLGAFTRPVDSALWGIMFFLLSVYFLITRKDRGELFRRFIFVLILSLAGIFLILSANKYYTGSYLKFPFHLFMEQEKWGIGSLGHTVYRGIWNTFYSLGRALSWGTVFLFEFALISLFCKEKKKAAFLWGVFLIFVAFYFGWYGIGNFEYGPRFYTSGIVYIFPAAAYGLMSFFEFLKTRMKQSNTLQNAFLVIILLYSVFVIYPPILSLTKTNLQKNSRVGLVRLANSLREKTGAKIAIFITGALEHKVDTLTRNLYPPEKQDILYFLFLEPEKDLELIQKHYPQHKPYIAYYNPGNDTFTLEEFPDINSLNSSQKAFFYLFSGMNYKFVLNDIGKAESNWLKAYKQDGKNLASLINIANMFTEECRFEKAVRYWEEILRLNPDIAIAYLSLGRISEFRKNDKQALAYYKEYLKRDAGSQDAILIQERINYFNRYGRFPNK